MTEREINPRDLKPGDRYMGAEVVRVERDLGQRDGGWFVVRDSAKTIFIPAGRTIRVLTNSPAPKTQEQKEREAYQRLLQRR